MLIRVDLCALKLSVLCEKISRQFSVLSKMPGTNIGVFFQRQHLLAELLLVLGSSLTTLAIYTFPYNLHGFEITKMCCQQNCRGFGQSNFALATIQNISSWKNFLRQCLLVVWVFLLPNLSQSSLGIGQCT